MTDAHGEVWGKQGMLAIILALASAVGYGCSDFAAGLASRTASVIQVSLLACMAGVVVVLAALPFAAGHRPSGAALAWGAAAGAGGTLGGIALYLGFRYAAFSVAAPLSAVGTAGFSVLAGLLWGERPNTLALIGIGLALPAIVGVSAGAGDAGQEAEQGAEQESGHGHRGRPAAGVAAGLIAGACFALLLIGLDRAG
ncbi:MAG: EamA family transporter, partial [Streptosporangiaceae bacterium]